MKSITVCVPIQSPVNSNKRFALNLNQYRNAHHHTLNNAKKSFHELMKTTLKNIPRFKSVKLTYTVYPKTKKLLDISNVASIVDKFFSDSLVELGIIEDDNYLFVTEITYCFGSVDNVNPRCEVTIYGETYADHPSTE